MSWIQELRYCWNNTTRDDKVILLTCMLQPNDDVIEIMLFSLILDVNVFFLYKHEVVCFKYKHEELG